MNSNLTKLRDRELLALIEAREPDALGVLYDRYVDPVWRFALLMCKRERDAEDVVLEAFLELWRTPQADSPDRLAIRLLRHVKLRAGREPSTARAGAVLQRRRQHRTA